MKTAAAILLALLLVCIPSFGQSENDDVLSRRLRDITINADNSFAVLKDISTRYSIPIGIETSPTEVATQKSNEELVIKDGTVKDVLNAFAKLNTQYEWAMFDRVINIYPKVAFQREPILDLKLTNFHSKNEDLNEVSRKILAHPDVLPFIESQGLVSNTDTTAFGVVNAETRSFSTQDLSVRELLNFLLKKKYMKCWVIYRNVGTRPYVKLVLQ